MPLHLYFFSVGILIAAVVLLVAVDGGDGVSNRNRSIRNVGHLVSNRWEPQTDSALPLLVDSGLLVR